MSRIGNYTHDFKKGDKVTTWGSKTIYEIDEVAGELVLKGVKPLSQVNCKPIKVADSPCK